MTGECEACGRWSHSLAWDAGTEWYLCVACVAVLAGWTWDVARVVGVLVMAPSGDVTLN